MRRESMNPLRQFLTADAWDEWQSAGHESDQSRGIPAPPVQQPVPEGALVVALPGPDASALGAMPLAEAIGARRSRRRYLETPLTLPEVSFLLWATQGVREVHRAPDGVRAFRTVPSAGCRHALETYLVVARVDGLKAGLYRYQPLEHQLCLLREDGGLPAQAAAACRGQRFVADAAVTFVWTAIPYRMEWRYTIVSPKLIALDAGHVCQNLYLACEAIGAGTCAIAAYSQDAMDALIGVDGDEEFTVYVAPVGKVR